MTRGIIIRPAFNASHPNVCSTNKGSVVSSTISEAETTKVPQNAAIERFEGTHGHEARFFFWRLGTLWHVGAGHADSCGYIACIVSRISGIEKSTSSEAEKSCFSESDSSCFGRGECGAVALTDGLRVLSGYELDEHGLSIWDRSCFSKSDEMCISRLDGH